MCVIVIGWSVKGSVSLRNAHRSDHAAQGRAQSYLVVKKRQGVSTKTEREGQRMAWEIPYIYSTSSPHYPRNVSPLCPII
ncbi:hypothetical protein ACN42_g858 [Penicillium freii]|uniref:Uncharacterized protein n=1 Tax=Penicillium freii TaxID=48697 RepID=A0A101MT92_PENFR|nr:hypothetical protein ACN42_g858 [Penicillium freii]